MHLNEHFIIKALPGVSLLYKKVPENFSFSVDTRTIKQGDMYIALSGIKSDGHDFIKEAFEKGAAGCIIAQDNVSCLSNIDTNILNNSFVAVVDNPRKALICLATAWRNQFSYPVIGITGSVGKTSTKEKIALMLDLAGKNSLVSHGNQNTVIGLSLNMLKMRHDHDLAVFEIGISRRGEMKQLAEMIQPTIGVITSIGHSHMEGLGSLVDIAAEKRDIFSLFKSDNMGVVNGDLPLLGTVGYAHPVIKFGSKTTNQIQARKIHIDKNVTTFVLKLYKKKYPIVLKTNHIGAVYNALATAAIGHLLNIPYNIIVQAISMNFIVAGRFEEKSLKNNKGILIDDCYNASPESMKAALLAFEHFETSGQKIAVLGDMAELGVNSPFWHRQLGRFLRKVPSLRKVILVGSMVEETKRTIPVGVEIAHASSWKEALSLLESFLKEESIVLVKGSRVVGLDNLVNACVTHS